MSPLRWLVSAVLAAVVAGPSFGCSGDGAANSDSPEALAPSRRANELSQAELEQFCAEAAKQYVSAWRDPDFIDEMCRVEADPDACRATYARRADDEEPLERTRCIGELVACDRTLSALARCAHDWGQAVKQNERNSSQNKGLPILHPNSCEGWLLCAAANSAG